MSKWGHVTTFQNFIFSVFLYLFSIFLFSIFSFFFFFIDIFYYLMPKLLRPFIKVVNPTEHRGITWMIYTRSSYLGLLPYLRRQGFPPHKEGLLKSKKYPTLMHGSTHVFGIVIIQLRHHIEKNHLTHHSSYVKKIIHEIRSTLLYMCVLNCQKHKYFVCSLFTIFFTNFFNLIRQRVLHLFNMN